MAHKIIYNFTFEDNSSWKYDISFDDDNIFIPKDTTEIKEWTKLDFHQCPNCPLNSGDYEQCPVARNLDQIVEDSKETLSCKMAKISITTKERGFYRECATQEGLRSLFGVIMASSGCPHLDWLRPLARFHLPFADIDETLFRVLSMQLLYLYFNDKEAKVATCIDEIKKHYQEIRTVNYKFIERIRSYCKADADKNALAALDVYAQVFPYEYEDDFTQIKNLFTSEVSQSA